MATFITSKAVGELINIYVKTSTGYWKYNHNGSDSSLLENTENKTTTNISITNVNGEFTIIPCDLEGNVTGNITQLYLETNQLTSFDGTGLSSLTQLSLGENQLTSFDGTGLSSLTELYLYNNLLTSFDGTGLSSLTYIEMNGNPFTPSVNNQILDQFNQIGLSGGYIMSSNGRTSASNADYDNLVNNLGWTFDGFDLIITPQLPTFITSKAVGETININVSTSTGFWKYNHDGSDSSINANGWNENIPVTNINGEFTLISCDESGNVSGDITILNLPNNQLTSFDGTGLVSLTSLNLYNNQLTSFDGTGLSSLTSLSLGDNQLTSFDGTGLSSLTNLSLNGPKGGGTLTSVSNLPTSLILLNLYNNQLTSFDGTGLSSLTNLYLNNNQFTPSSNNQILQQLNQNGLSGGYFQSSNGRTSASNTDYDNLVSLGWSFDGLNLITPPPVGNGKLRVKGFRPIQPQPWDGGTIYNIGAVVTHEGQTWNCIQYAPSGYGPFGGYIDVYWTL